MQQWRLVLGDGRSLSFVNLARILYKPLTNAGRSQPLNNATAFGIVRADFNLHSVADCEAYVMNLKLPRWLGQYAMPAIQSDAKKVTAHRFGNCAKKTGSRFLHYSPLMNFGTFVPATVLTAVGAHSCPAAIAANIAWRNASSALTASERACIDGRLVVRVFVAWTEVAVSSGHGYALGIGVS